MAPGDLEGHLARAKQARDAGDYEASLDAMRRAYALEPAPELLNNVAWLLNALGRYDEAHQTYLSIAKDPNAPAGIRDLDAKRADQLAPKLAQAWLRVEAPQCTLEIDGRTYALKEEIGLRDGPWRIVLRRRGTTDAILRVVELTRGRRADVRVDPSELDPSNGRLLFEGLTANRVSVDGTVIRLDGLRTLRLRANRYEIAIGDERPRVIEVRPRATVTLATVMAPEASGTPVLVAPAPEPAMNVGPPIVTALGLVLGGAAAGLLVAAESDRNTVRDAERDASGVITGITLREADELETRANDRATAGVVIGSAALVTAIAGVVWWLVGDDEPAAVTAPAGKAAATWRF